MDHIHVEGCTGPNKEWAKDSLNPVNPRGLSYNEMKMREQRQANLLESKFGIPKGQQNVIFECQWSRWKTTTDMTKLEPWEHKWAKAVQGFIARYDKLRPRHRLIPREGLKGEAEKKK